MARMLQTGVCAIMQRAAVRPWGLSWGAVLLLAIGVRSVQAVQVLRSENALETGVPTVVSRVVHLITDLQAKIESDGKLEQKSYDKYACWCEDTLGRKASDIATGKERIKDLEGLILQLEKEISVHGSDIEQLKKDIAANIAATKEATTVREKEAMDYEESKTETEQCLGALESAIKILTGAGELQESKKSLNTLQEAQLLGAVAGIRGLLKMAVVTNSASDEDIQLVRQFVEKPQTFVGDGAGAMSAAQVGNNPFGDYAPQSTKIQSILKGMYDSFTAQLEKSNAQEAEQQKGFEALMATKKAELATLEATLEKQALDAADKKKQAADSRTLLDDTKTQLAADEAFFATTKLTCQAKAAEWAERVRLRSEELHGIATAIQILDSPEAQAIFENATSFMQISAASRSQRNAGEKSRKAAYQALSTLAKRYHSASLAGIAADLKMGGHFDDVIKSIDGMIALLRTEEGADIRHRDRCQGSQNANSNTMEDLGYTIDKAEKAIQLLEDKATQLRSEITALQGEIDATQEDMDELLAMRNADHENFVGALKDDADAVVLLENALAVLTEFYVKNKIPLSMVSQRQKVMHKSSHKGLHKKGEPEFEYFEDPDKAPELEWNSAGYGGRKTESRGLLAIIGLIKEDLEKEMSTARTEEAKAQSAYEYQKLGLKKSLDAQTNSRVSVEQELAAVESHILEEQTFKAAKSGDLDAQKALADSIYKDCSWVEQFFDSRMEKRKAEISGLQEAKAYLAGVDSGEELSFDGSSA